MTNPALLEHRGETALRCRTAYRRLGRSADAPRSPEPARVPGGRVCACRAARLGHSSSSDAVGNPLSPASLDPVPFHHNTAISYHFEPTYPCSGDGKRWFRNYTTRLHMKLDFQPPSEPAAIQGCYFHLRAVTSQSFRKNRAPARQKYI